MKNKWDVKMIGEDLKNNCPKCGSKMIIKKETKTFDETIVEYICVNCRYVCGKGISE